MLLWQDKSWKCQRELRTKSKMQHRWITKGPPTHSPRTLTNQQEYYKEPKPWCKTEESISRREPSAGENNSPDDQLPSWNRAGKSRAQEGTDWETLIPEQKTGIRSGEKEKRIKTQQERSRRKKNSAADGTRPSFLKKNTEKIERKKKKKRVRSAEKVEEEEEERKRDGVDVSGGAMGAGSMERSFSRVSAPIKERAREMRCVV